MRASPAYSVSQAEKEAALLRELNELTEHHREHCSPYDRLLRAIRPGYTSAQRLADIPYIPVGLFKSHRLRSVPEEQVFRVLTSSGTTGQQASQVVLDRETAQRQVAALARIMTQVLGNDRLPMILVESAGVLQDKARFSARAAGLLGMMNFGRHHFYALDDRMNLDEQGLRGFLERFGNQRFLVFGFTFMVWTYFYRRLPAGTDLSRGVLIHSGGWKKLEEQAVSNGEFKQRLREKTGISAVYNFYGMVEQVGSVFLEGEDGFLYAPSFADVIVRDPVTFEEARPGTPGIIQVLSSLPRSYPGHSILTEDMGILRGVDDSTCGRMGKYFTVSGRVPKAELRGCGDTHAAQAAA